MADQTIAVVPSKKQHVHVLLSGKPRGREFRKPGPSIDFLAQQKNRSAPIVLGTMGGIGQELFVRLMDLGFPVYRIPMYRLQELSGVEPKADSKERAFALQSAWEANPDAFYLMEHMDWRIELIRVLARQRLGIQSLRKPAQLRVYGSLRPLEFILPEQAASLVDMFHEGLKEFFRKPELLASIEAEFVRLEQEVALTDAQQARILAIRTFFTNPAFVLGAKQDEQGLEKQLSGLLSKVPIYHYLAGSSVLPPVKGFGPALGGVLVGEIGDIRRFPTPADLRAYARFHLVENEEGRAVFPHRREGRVSPWNTFLNQAVWFWSTDQLARYDHPWRLLYYWKKALECWAHTEVISRQVRTRQGRLKTVYDFTLKHLDSRAKRWVGSQFLEYWWHLCQEVSHGRNPEQWYLDSSWPAFFARAQTELESGLAEFLKAERQRRRRTEPKEEEDEEEEI